MLKLVDNIVASSDPGNPHKKEVKKQIREAVDIFDLLRWSDNLAIVWDVYKGLPKAKQQPAS